MVIWLEICKCVMQDNRLSLCHKRTQIVTFSYCVVIKRYNCCKILHFCIHNTDNEVNRNSLIKYLFGSLNGIKTRIYLVNTT